MTVIIFSQKLKICENQINNSQNSQINNYFDTFEFFYVLKF